MIAPTVSCPLLYFGPLRQIGDMRALRASQVLEVREPQLIVSSGGGECRTCLEAGLQEALNPLSVRPLSKPAAAKDIKGALLLPAVSRALQFPPSILFFSGTWVMRISLTCGGLQKHFIMLHYP
jgi:hypothetical protein